MLLASNSLPPRQFPLSATIDYSASARLFGVCKYGRYHSHYPTAIEPFVEVRRHDYSASATKLTRSMAAIIPIFVPMPPSVAARVCSAAPYARLLERELTGVGQSQPSTLFSVLVEIAMKKGQTAQIARESMSERTFFEWEWGCKGQWEERCVSPNPPFMPHPPNGCHAPCAIYSLSFPR